MVRDSELLCLFGSSLGVELAGLDRVHVDIQGGFGVSELMGEGLDGGFEGGELLLGKGEL